MSRISADADGRRATGLRALAALALLAAAVALAAWLAARADPVMRTARIAMRGWPAGAPPIRVALVSDLHLGSASTGVGRLTRAMRAITAARPDVILLAGDYVDGAKHGPIPELVAPLRELHAPLGVVAVLGNHDWYAGAPAIRRALHRAGIIVLENRALARGPLALAGLGDGFTHHDNRAAMLAALRGTPGVPLVLMHSPDPAAKLPPGLVLAGHTHCGQINLPFLDTLKSVSAYGDRFACGVIREGGRIVVVGAGMGTSDLPFRIAAPPDWWLLTLGPVGRATVADGPATASPRPTPR
jgi:hypothetical protein